MVEGVICTKMLAFSCNLTFKMTLMYLKTVVAGSVLIFGFSSILLRAETPVDGSYVQRLLDKQQGKTVEARLDQISEAFLELPYSYPDDPLGEGKQGQYDQDPLYRFDRFNCTTFVETVLALATSDSTDVFQRQINRIRYKGGKPSFVGRNHFISLDWIPNNNWLLTDITEDVAGRFSQVATATIDKKAWYASLDNSRLQIPLAPVQKQERLLSLQTQGQTFVPQKAEIPYLPLAVLFPNIEGEAPTLASKSKADQFYLDKIPSGAIINIVNPNWDLTQWIGTHINVSHQGIAVRKAGKLYFRHASSLSGQVDEVLLSGYLSDFLGSETVKGINILQVKK
jgi:hypothetical protein